MIGKLVGAMHKKGTGKDKDTGRVFEYDNIELVILSPIQTGGEYQPLHAVGLCPERNTKFKAENLTQVFGDKYNNLDSLGSLMGSDVEYFFDSSKKICKVLPYGK